MITQLIRIFATLVLCFSQLLVPSTSLGGEAGGFDYVHSINSPESLEGVTTKKITIAIVDDGLRGSHRDIQPFLWKNPREIAGNRIDDDGNNRVDDLHGWDVGDNDDDFFPPANRLPEFYHGTHLAGIITSILTHAYGAKASKLFSILPIKSISDETTTTIITHGYQGIKYGIDQDVDIILCAWSSAFIKEGERAILEKAREKSILIIGAAGNGSQEQAMYPAGHEDVLAVAATDKVGNPLPRSSYGSHIDLSAPGVDVLSSGVLFDDATYLSGGTSQAAAMVAAAAAIIKAQHPELSPDELTARLLHSSRPYTSITPDSTYIGRMGAGVLDINRALSSEITPELLSQRTTGFLRLQHQWDKPQHHKITAPPSFKGFYFTRQKEDQPGDGEISFFSKTQGKKTLHSSYPLEELPESVYVPGAEVTVSYSSPSGKETPNLLLRYRAEPIDFRTLYCSGTKFAFEEGSIHDGSGDASYSAHSDCKWQIKAPPGKVIRFQFSRMDTEPRKDLIYFFNGKGTHEKIMAIFSGPDIPPLLHSWTNEVLVWFITDGKTQGKGWQLDYNFVDDPYLKQ